MMLRHCSSGHTSSCLRRGIELQWRTKKKNVHSIVLLIECVNASMQVQLIFQAACPCWSAMTWAVTTCQWLSACLSDFICCAVQFSRHLLILIEAHVECINRFPRLACASALRIGFPLFLLPLLAWHVMFLASCRCPQREWCLSTTCPTSTTSPCCYSSKVSFHD